MAGDSQTSERRQWSHSRESGNPGHEYPTCLAVKAQAKWGKCPSARGEASLGILA